MALSMVEIEADRINRLLENIALRLARRYDYYAIDIYDKQGKCLDTLVAGLSRREAKTVLEALYYVLLNDR